MQAFQSQIPGAIAPDQNRFYRKEERKNFSRIFFAPVLYLMVSAAVSLAFGAIVGAFFPNWAESQGYNFWMQVIPAYLVAFPLAWLMLSRCPKKNPEKKPSSFRKRIIFMAASFTALQGGNMVAVYIEKILESVLGTDSGDALGEVIGKMSPLVMLLLVVIIGPIVEELFFRKILMGRLLPYSDRLAVLISGVVFGLFHGNLRQFFYASLVGLVLGYVYLETGRLSHTIFLHMLLNFTGSFIPFLLQRQAETEAALAASINPWELVYGLYSFSILLLCVAGIFLFFINFDKIKLKKEGDRGLTFKSQLQLAIGNPGMLVFLAVSALSILGSIFLL